MKCPNCGKKMKGDICKKCGYDASVKVEQPAMSKTVAWKKYRVYDPENPDEVYSLEASTQGQPNPALGATEFIQPQIHTYAVNKAANKQALDERNKKLYTLAGWMFIIYPLLAIILESLVRYTSIFYRNASYFTILLRYIGNMGFWAGLNYCALALLGILCFVKVKYKDAMLNMIMGMSCCVVAGFTAIIVIDYLMRLIMGMLNGAMNGDYIYLMVYSLMVVEFTTMAVIFFRGKSGKEFCIPAISNVLEIALVLTYYGLTAYRFNIFSLLLILIEITISIAMYCVGKVHKE